MYGLDKNLESKTFYARSRANVRINNKGSNWFDKKKVIYNRNA